MRDGCLVDYLCRDAVATITLRREHKLNAFNAELVRDLAAALRRFDEDANAQVAVLSGAGRAFSTGADVRERQARTVEEFERLGGPQEPDAHSYQLFNRSVNWKPVISAVHGHVLGLGLGIAFETDLLVAERGTQFQITETPRGLGGARYWGLLRFCGATAFGTEVALTGRYFTAEEAHAQGLVTRLAEVGEAQAVALQLASEIAQNPPLSVRATVRARRWFIESLCREIAAQTDPMKLYLTSDFREAVNAFLERRPVAPFSGR
nr:enoyl-CoA hydratase/isomerase family protein [Pararobbsia silviterrae]